MLWITGPAGQLAGPAFFMSDTIDSLLDALLEREADLGATIVWGGSSYPCAGGSDFAKAILTPGGFKETTALTIVVRIGSFPGGVGFPAAKQTLSYLCAPGATGRSLRIEAVTQALGVFLVLNCIDPAQGA